MVRLPLSHILLIWLAGMLCVVMTMGHNTLNEHEVFAAEPAREMLHGGSLILQPFAGQYRTKKPPGQSWLIAAALAVVRVRNEWTARLPSALAGIGLAWLVGVMANRPDRPWRGLIAAMMALTCVSIQQYISLAEADMALALTVALANAVILTALLRRAPISRAWAFAFWGALVGGFLLKGPVCLGFTLLPALVAWAILRFAYRNRSAATAIARVAFWWPAVLFGIVVIAAWPVAALAIYPPALAQWKYELVDRARGTLGHKGTHRSDPVYTYFVALPFGLMPWVIFLPCAAIWAWRNRAWRRPASLFVLCWGGVGFVLLTAVAFKTLHYALSIVPAFILACAVGFDALLTWWLRRRPIRKRSIWRRGTLAIWLGSAVVGWTIYQQFISPMRQNSNEILYFSKRVNDLVPPDQTLYLYNLIEERTAWYLNNPLRQTTELPPKPAYVMCAAGDLPTLQKAGTIQELTRAKPYLNREAPEEMRVLVHWE